MKLLLFADDMVIRNNPIGIQEKVNRLHDYCAEIFVQLISAIFSTIFSSYWHIPFLQIFSSDRERMKRITRVNRGTGMLASITFSFRLIDINDQIPSMSINCIR